MVFPLFLLLGLSQSVFSQDESETSDGSFLQALKDGDFSLSFRYRLELVDDDKFDENAEASTLRSRINYKSGKFHDFGFFVEVDNVTQVGPDNFNNTRNGLTQFPVVADPSGTNVNQAWIDFTPNANNRFAIGRQRINFDNQRFIGGVAWRQNEQTYDTLGWENSSIDGLDFQYGYINRVKRIFGPDDGVPVDDFDSDSHIIHLEYDKLPIGKISAYSYLLDFNNANALSTQTYGVRAVGDFDVGQYSKLGYKAEWATQNDFASNPVDFSADYYFLEFNGGYKGINAALGYEVLEGDSDPGGAFRTPLATLHKFQGFVDQFLVTPDAGIEDLYLSLGTELYGFKLSVVYHDFNSQVGSENLGEELNVLLVKSFGRYGTLLLKYGNYYADTFAFDAQRFWVQYTFGF